MIPLNVSFTQFVISEHDACHGNEALGRDVLFFEAWNDTLMLRIQVFGDWNRQIAQL